MLRGCAILAGVLLLFTSLTTLNYSQAEEPILPEWVKNIFVWFGEGVVSESELLGAIEWLIENNIIKVKEDSSSQDETNWRGMASVLLKENQDLKRDLKVLQTGVTYWKNKYDDKIASEDFADSLSEELDKVRQKAEYPKTTIDDQNVKWEFYDSKDNFYTWKMPMETYESYIRATEPYKFFTLIVDDEHQSVRDHTEFVRESFTNVIGEVYDNAGSNEAFIYEVWYIVSQLTTYSTDIGEDPRWALETFTRGGGDCEDLAILIADMIRSSEHSTFWDMEFVYFDADNPSRAKQVNHVAIKIDVGNGYYFIEPTAKTLDELNYWNKIGISGWYFDV